MTMSADDPVSIIAIANDFLRRHGILATIAAALIWWMATTLQTAVTTAAAKTDQTLFELRQHATDSSYFARQQCINTAVLAGTAKELCDPPGSRR